jgi:drug/metabolite transporter, DME family
MTTTIPERATGAGLPFVVVAASLWGTSALFRQGLAESIAPTTLVFYEHVILTAVMLPVLVRIPWRKLTAADVASLLVIGAGASGLATVLFTTSLRYGAVNTTLLLQQLQPLIAVAAARLLLGERLTPRYALYFSVAVVAAWLVTFRDPLDVGFEQAAPALLSAGAAALWALGTVLGRRMSGRLTFTELTAARFGIGLPAAFLYATVFFGRGDPLTIGPADIGPLLGVVFIPGLLALLLYYNGLRRTPASLATLGELAFPASALIVNYLAFDAVVTFSQATGVAMMSAVLVTMSVAARRRAARVGVEVAADGADVSR